MNKGKGTKRMKKLRVQLRAVFYQEDGLWFAHCLEMDVLGHGKSKEEALKMLNGAIAETITQSLKHNNRRNIFMPAEAKYFEMFFAGKDAVRGHCTFVENKPVKVDHVEIENVDTREYNGQLVHA